MGWFDVGGVDGFELVSEQGFQAAWAGREKRECGHGAFLRWLGGDTLLPPQFLLNDYFKMV